RSQTRFAAARNLNDWSTPASPEAGTRNANMKTKTFLAALAAATLSLAIRAQGPATPLTPKNPPQTATLQPRGEPVTPPAPEQGATLSAEDANSWLDGFVPYALATGDIAGAEIAIVKDGAVITERGYGFADVQKRTPVDPKLTLFRPGSVSKLIVWTAVMQQVQAGKI